ncbi:MAG: oligoribonuclease [Proteobacteria bacterium]|nr:oligoribonuclease [Pseudomonadota bacterium]
MTGLNPMKDHVIEIATIVTDKNLNIIANGPSVAIHQSEKTLSQMDDWNTEHHSNSGLWDRVLASDLSHKDAELLTLEFLKEHVPIHTSPMCGNTICQDRRFLAKWMPKLENYFHYRHIDVSTIKELIRRWNPKLLDGFQKTGQHLALADIQESIKELQY